VAKPRKPVGHNKHTFSKQLTYTYQLTYAQYRSSPVPMFSYNSGYCTYYCDE